MVRAGQLLEALLLPGVHALSHSECLQDAERVQTFKHRMNTLAYGEAMMAAARDYGQVSYPL